LDRWIPVKSHLGTDWHGTAKTIHPGYSAAMEAGKPDDWTMPTTLIAGCQQYRRVSMMCDRSWTSFGFPHWKANGS